MWKMICGANTQHAVFYADDAFDGLHVMEDLAAENGNVDERLAKAAR